MKKSWISSENQKASLHWTRTFQDKPQTFWNMFLWSEKSKFDLLRFFGMVRVWRKPSEAHQKQPL
jgi:hypothetical protein